ncbi:unnamed protein product [Porites evermanni]|uniref:SAM domain-containing protein n=1 Tax=Porites evermanni TaxID=104178 RepID=A0ABN8MIB2_9CNID|nr:unnamed protein product [Porites evermanni]
MAVSGNVVKTFLEKINLEKYSGRLVGQGYQTALDLCLLNEEDLNLISVTDKEDREKILQAASELDIEVWLNHMELDSYINEFKREGIHSVKDLRAHEISDDLLDALEVMIPGHRKRIKTAVSFLNSNISGPDDVSVSAVVIGYWGQPTEMEGNNFDFLCVPGFLKSSTGEDAQSSGLIQFIVDSGSEVGVTVTSQFIKDLQLEYLHNIESRGVHATRDRPVYRGVLKLGLEEFEVEVMPDRFCTVGAVVMRKFKHFINGHLHRWLKDDPQAPDNPPSQVEDC